MSSKANLKDVAEKAEVSVITASRAIRGVGRVNENTRRRVLAAADKLGYQRHRNMLLSGTGQAFPADHCLRLLVPLFRPCADPVGDVFGAYVLDRMRREVEEQGGVFTIVEVDDLKDLKKNLPRARIHGIVLRQVLPVKWLRELLKIAPVVNAISHDVMPKVDAVYFNEFKAASIIFEKALKLGHRNIAWITWDRSNPLGSIHEDSYDFDSGFDRQALNFTRARYGAQCALDLGMRDDAIEHQRLVLPLPVLSWQKGIDVEKAGLDVTKAILKAKSRPTAVVVSSGDVAVATRHHLENKGIRVPEDISMLTYLSPRGLTQGPRTISGIHLPFDQVGRMIPEMIQRRLTNPKAAYISVMVEPEFKDYGTLAQAPE